MSRRSMLSDPAADALRDALLEQWAMGLAGQRVSAGGAQGDAASGNRACAADRHVCACRWQPCGVAGDLAGGLDKMIQTPADQELPPPPAEFSELAATLGTAGLLRLIEAHGGVRINVGVKPSAAMIAAIGAPAAAALSREYGGNRLTVPLAKRWLVQVYLSRGESADMIARKLNVGIDTVWRTKRQQAARAAQPNTPSRQLRLGV